jgi:hypothetical protein
LLLSNPPAQADAGLPFNTPKEVSRCLKKVASQYKVSYRINPFYLRGDFDGDGKPDYAVLITSLADGSRGLAVCGSQIGIQILGAGVSFDKMKDLDFNAWRVYAKGPVGPGVESGPPPKMTAEALLIEWAESASGLVYWT